jgi:hypothetical protein
VRARACVCVCETWSLFKNVFDKMLTWKWENHMYQRKLLKGGAKGCSSRSALRTINEVYVYIIFW